MRSGFRFCLFRRTMLCPRTAGYARLTRRRAGAILFLQRIRRTVSCPSVSSTALRSGREARELIRTARVSPIKFTLLFLAVSLALSLLDTALTSLTGRIVGVAFVSVSFASILIGLITQVLDAGYKCYCLGVHRREEMPYESLFDGFTFAGKVIALYIVEGFFVALWSMLFVIPGIIAVYRYSFAIWNLARIRSLA